MEHGYLAILLRGLVLKGVSKLVLSSGQSQILTIDYARIADPEQLHRWAAKWLSGAAFATALLALAAFAAPAFAELFLALFCILVLGTAVAITLGARRFRHAKGN
jgi:hypothetical protein